MTPILYNSFTHKQLPIYIIMKNNTQDNSVNDELERLFSDSKKKSRRVKKEKPSSPSKKAGSPDGKKGEEKKKNQKKIR